MSGTFGGRTLFAGHDSQGRQVTIVETYELISGRDVVTLEIGRDATLELDEEMRRGIAQACDEIDGLARAVGVLREPVTSIREGGGSR